MGKVRIAGTAGRDRIDLTGKERALDPGFDGFEVFAGDGADIVIGSAAHDVLRGEAGDDALRGGKGNDVLLGGTGNDALDGGEGIDTVSYQGQRGFVDVDLNAGTGKVMGLAPGLFPIFGVTEQDTLDSIENATAGDDGSRLVGNAANNVLTGGRGGDLLVGGAGNDTLIGGEGVDTASYAGETRFVDVNLIDGAAKVVSAAGLVVEQDALSGIENVIAGSGGSRIVGDHADNRLTGGNGVDDLQGGIGADTLLGGAGDDMLSGGGQNDTLAGGTGSDILDGGAGIDTVSYAGQSGFVAVDLQPGPQSDFGGVYYDAGIVSVDGIVTEQDSLHGIENVTAGDGGSNIRGDVRDNVLIGGAGHDRLDGSRGSDTLIGNDGRDTLSGGRDGEADTLTGGADSDTFVRLAYQAPDPIADHVTDFDVEQDLLDVSEFFGSWAPEMSAAEAISQGYLVIQTSGAAGQDTTVTFDLSVSGTWAPGTAVALFVLEGVEAATIRAQHFLT